MNIKSLVSVVIPAYNAEGFINETVNSVLGQTYSHLELIVVNDGSKDNTFQILKELKKTDSRIKVIDKPNSGVCDSRNMGMKAAKGDYITFLDADDVWELTFIECCLSVFNSDKNIGAVYSDIQLINENSEKLDEYILANTIKSASDVLEWKRGFVASMGCTVYSSDLVEKVGLFDPVLSTAADQDFHLRIAAVTPIVAINKVLFFYRIHGKNMHQNIDVMEKDHIYVFNKAKKNKLFKGFWFQQKCFAHLYWILAGSWWKDGNNKSKGIYFVVLALFANPFSIIRFFKLLLK